MYGIKFCRSHYSVKHYKTQKWQRKQKSLQPDDILGDQFCNFPLGDDGVVHVKSSVLPLNGAVDVERITQPVVRRSAKCQHNNERHIPSFFTNKLCGRPPQYAPAPCKLTFDLLTLKVVSESHVTWVTSVPISVFLGLSVLDLRPMYATDTDRRQSRIIA